MDASSHTYLNKVTLRDLVRVQGMLLGTPRNTTLAISGYTPVELATGRRPTDHADLELMKPDQLSAVDQPRDATPAELKKLALRAHLEARPFVDLQRDLARRVPPSDGQNVDYVVDFAAFMAKVTKGSFSTLNVSFDIADQVLELSTPRCSMTPLPIDYGLKPVFHLTSTPSAMWTSSRRN